MLVKRITVGCFVVIHLNGCALFRDPSPHAVAIPHAAFDLENRQPERPAFLRSRGHAVRRGPATEPQAALQKSETDRRRWLQPNDVVMVYGLTSLTPRIDDPMQTASVATVIKYPSHAVSSRVCQGC